MRTFSYYPYGGTISATPGTVAITEEPYQFAGNEIDMFSDYDFHARIYDPATGRFTTPDPLAEKYCSLSPYVYCADNPVNYVDPDGEDIWEMNMNGTLVRVEESERTYIYALNSDGRRTGKFIRLANDNIPESFQGTSGAESFQSRTGVNSIFKFFLFASDNTNVEWVIHRNGDMYTLGTKHDESSSGSYRDYDIKLPNASVHSHPGVVLEKEQESMGYWEKVNGGYENPQGDWAKVVNNHREHGRITRHSYVYMPNSGNLFYVGLHKPIYINNVRNYKQFFFGVLNLK